MALPPALAALAFLVAQGAAPAPAPFDLDLGGASLRLTVGLEVRAAPGAGHGPTEGDGPGAPRPAAQAVDLALPLTWRTAADGALLGEARAPLLDAEVRLAPAGGGARRVEVRLRWRGDAGLERAAVRLGWPGRWPGAVGRDLTARPLAGPVRTGRGTPLLAWAGPALLTGGPGLVAAALAPAGRGDGLSALLLLDDADERPFATYLECLEALPRGDGQARAWAGLERKRAWRLAPRRAGDEDRLSATLSPRGPGGAGPLVPLRWARGAGAAVVLTDHADRTGADALRAVLYGHSDPRAEGGAGAGLLGRGLAITRSFFAWSGPGTLADPASARLADRLVAAGSEVALHSISDGRDDREAVQAGLAATARWAPETWIDHEPYVNCEALSSRGGGPAAGFGVRDLLLDGGVRWAWAAGDVAGFRRVELADLFQVAPPGAPCPVLYPLPGEPGLWLFETSFFYAPPRELAAAVSEPALERLEAAQGLFVGHSYLGAGPAGTRGAQAEGRLVVHPAPGGGLVLDAALDEAFARLASHAAAGRLTSLTWAEAGDRLRALGEVEVRHLPDGSAEVLNRGERGVAGLTLAAPVPGLEWWVDGQPAEVNGAGTRLWFDLPAGARRLVTATLLGGAVPLVPSTPTPTSTSTSTSTPTPTPTSTSTSTSTSTVALSLPSGERAGVRGPALAGGAATLDSAACGGAP